MIDIGTGPAVVLVPGIQGRWEWMRPTVDALASHFRVLSYSLAGERTSGHRLEQSAGFDSFVAQLDAVLDHAALPDAVVCGVSYGGLIALQYAACCPRRVRALVLASALAPGYTPDDRVRFYARSPWLSSPLFAVNAWRRSRPEVRCALPNVRERLAFSISQLARIAAHPASPRQMRDRIRLLETVDFTSIGSLDVPALIVTGEAALDTVVPTGHTLGYTRLLPRAEQYTLERTGHIGVVTRPAEFARAVAEFVAHCHTSGHDVPSPAACGTEWQDADRVVK
jgi:3-oxoadipate enol-lactonase